MSTTDGWLYFVYEGDGSASGVALFALLEKTFLGETRAAIEVYLFFGKNGF